MSTGQKTLLGAMGLAVAVLVGLTVHGLREDPTRASATKATAETPAMTDTGGVPRHAETPPWQTPRDSKEPLPPGSVPVWRVDPPPPDRAAPMPAAPVEPPNPATHRPAMDNPGGVNGDRPERAVPGL